MTETEINQEKIQTENCNNQENDLQQKIVKLEDENRNLNDQFLRLAAELENTRKRGKEEVEKVSKYAISNFVGELVLVMENFYLASENINLEENENSKQINSFVEAMLMTKKDLNKILEKFGVKRIYPLGEKFDHNYHEAIIQAPSEEGEEAGLIKKVVQAGYQIGDRLIRPALVSVSV